jgi:CMP/dCMP kinase
MCSTRVFYIFAVIKCFMDSKQPSKIIIAIDGHASSGKSTLAKNLAEALAYRYVDTGAMYRAVALYFKEKGINFNNPAAVKTAMDKIDLRFKYEQGVNRLYLNGINVDDAIRSMEISEIVSEVAKIPHVRKIVVAQQQAMGKDKGIVMDGRDIGTVVFPNAELKIFLTADGVERARRRSLEMEETGQVVEFQEVLENLQHRDFIDSTRTESPLRIADGAICIDSTSLNREALFNKVLQLVKDRINA